MIMGQLCDTWTNVVYLNHPLLSKADDSIPAKAVNNVQSDNQIPSPPKDAKSQLANDWRSSVSIPDHYTAYREDSIRMLKSFQ